MSHAEETHDAQPPEFDCPACGVSLQPTKLEGGINYVCPKCHGRAVTLAVVRHVTGRPMAQTIWNAAKAVADRRGQSCPTCERPMHVTPLGFIKPRGYVEVCSDCQFVWFAAAEFEQLPRVAPPQPKKSGELSQKAKELMAEHMVKKMAEDDRGGDFGSETPEQSWKLLPALFGMPVLQDEEGLYTPPWVTWGVSAVLVIVFILTAANLEPAVKEFGLRPDRFARLGGLTFITSFFLHGGVMHLIGNVYFLLVFGPKVEDHLGRLRFAAVLILAALFGDILHILADPRVDMPGIGASGGISGVLTYYAFQFPRSRLGFLFFILLYPKWVHVPAYFALAFWIVLQLFTAHRQLEGASAVSAMAHLGGAAVGVVAWMAWRKFQRFEDEEETEPAAAA